MAKSDEQVAQEFDEAVNMSSKELEEWLETDKSKEVGQKDRASFYASREVAFPSTVFNRNSDRNRMSLPG